MIDRRYLGTGWKFPLRVGPRGGLAWSSAEENVRESIWLILATARGEREMNPRFGCGMHDLVFSPNGPTARGSVAAHVREALTEWEPRIDLLDVDVDSPRGEENLMLIRVDYRVRGSNTSRNLVYPFYIDEAVAV
jgi:phage baseplate assembly protein W